MKTRKQALEVILNTAAIVDGIKATKTISTVVKELKTLKAQSKVIAINESALREKIETFMGNNMRLIDTDGTIAVTWIKGEPTQKLDLETLKIRYPQAYSDCLIDIDGRRMFLVK